MPAESQYFAEGPDEAKVDEQAAQAWISESPEAGMWPPQSEVTETTAERNMIKSFTDFCRQETINLDIKTTDPESEHPLAMAAHDFAADAVDRLREDIRLHRKNIQAPTPVKREAIELMLIDYYQNIGNTPRYRNREYFNKKRDYLQQNGRLVYREEFREGTIQRTPKNPADAEVFIALQLEPPLRRRNYFIAADAVFALLAAHGRLKRPPINDLAGQAIRSERRKFRNGLSPSDIPPNYQAETDRY